MRKSVRTLAATALAVPMTLGVAGTALAQDGDVDVNEERTQTQSTTGTASNEQSALTDQANDSISPVTQANPAFNVSDVLGLGNFANEDSVSASEQSIVQDNGIDSTTEQGNVSETDQAQKSLVEQLTSLAG
ncbi:hypothetical protein WIS52_23130 [Pseudonocardia nematodicida]|uniref:Secreted protein n=1 Tax=Pseudonocardia nematodicida TaxID=1206997 RepID=A0ABV1KGA4_9PSEU